MPSSFPEVIPEVVRAVMALQPRSLLDVGTGFGKYGVLCREYLEVYGHASDYVKRSTTIDGIEAFRGYLTPLHEFIYDRMLTQPAEDVLAGIPDKRYDLALLIDVIEHMDKDVGHSVLAQCLRVAQWVVVSTPLFSMTQSAHHGNEYQRHRTCWPKRDFGRYPLLAATTPGDSLVLFLGEQDHPFFRRYRFPWSIRAKLGLLLDLLGLRHSAAALRRRLGVIVR